jgi:hypothetical protein
LQEAAALCCIGHASLSRYAAGTTGGSGTFCQALSLMSTHGAIERGARN